MQLQIAYANTKCKWGMQRRVRGGLRQPRQGKMHKLENGSATWQKNKIPNTNAECTGKMQMRMHYANGGLQAQRGCKWKCKLPRRTCKYKCNKYKWNMQTHQNANPDAKHKVEKANAMTNAKAKCKMQM